MAPFGLLLRSATVLNPWTTIEELPSVSTTLFQPMRWLNSICKLSTAYQRRAHPYLALNLWQLGINQNTGCFISSDMVSNLHKIIIFWSFKAEILNLETSDIYIFIIILQN